MDAQRYGLGGKRAWRLQGQLADNQHLMVHITERLYISPPTITISQVFREEFISITTYQIDNGVGINDILN